MTVRMADVASTMSAMGSMAASSSMTSSSASGSRRSASGATRSQSSSTSGAGTPSSPLSDAENEQLVKYGLMAVGGLVALKILASAMNLLSILLLPLLYLYACTNCPPMQSFDAKRELKRVMRGAHLPEERQPGGFFERGLNRLVASATAELATSLGYEVEVTEFAGAARMAAVKVPVAGAQYYWIGVFGE